MPVCLQRVLLCSYTMVRAVFRRYFCTVYRKHALWTPMLPLSRDFKRPSCMSF